MWELVRPRVGAFCAIINNVEDNHESGSSDLTVYQKACVEYLVVHGHAFTFEQCWNILKDYQAWKEVELPAFLKLKKSRKKFKTSETTSDGGSNLNEEADESEEETREKRPTGRDQAKKNKKKSSASDQSKSSFSDAVADKFLSIKSFKWGKNLSATEEYFHLKKQELEAQEVARRKQAELTSYVVNLVDISDLGS